MARYTDKKERLIKAADLLFLLKGLSDTTLADIAGNSGVPLGNVYYYFKTKMAIVSDIIKLRHKLLQDILARIEAENTTPVLQLKTFIKQFLNLTEEAEQDFGVMLTVLWQELSREGGQLFTEFLPSSEVVLDWCAKKFEALGKSNQAREYSIALLSFLQGANLMRKDPKAKQWLPQQANFIEQAVGIAG